MKGTYGRVSTAGFGAYFCLGRELYYFIFTIFTWLTAQEVLIPLRIYTT